VKQGAVAALLAGILELAPGGVAADAPRWSVHGPEGGTISTLEVDPERPNVLYAGTHGAGVFRSADAGRTWQRSSDGLPPDTLVLALELAPSRPSTLYLEAHAGSALYRSTDGARSWQALPPINAGISDVDVDPTRADSVYVATHEGLLRSTNGGSSWTKVGSLQSPSRLAIAPSAPQVLYAEDGGRVLRSADGGATWAQQSTWTEGFDAFAVDPRDPNTVYVSTADSVYRSSDAGVHWTRIRSGGPGVEIFVLAIDARDSRRLFVGGLRTGVYGSSDAGANWSRVAALPRERVRDLEVANGVVYAGLDHRGLFRSSGGRWVASSRGLIGSDVRALVVDPASPAIVYAGATNAGVARTTNGGRTWAARGLAGRIVDALAVFPRTHAVLAGVAGGVFRSTDGGRRWHKARGIAEGDVRALAIAPSEPRIVYAGTFERGSYRSADGGATWKRLRLRSLETVTSMAVHPSRPNTVWAGTREDGVIRSLDGGRTWKAGRGVPTGDDVLALVVDQSDPRRLFAGLDAAGVFTSVDGGENWSRLQVLPGSGERWSFALALDRRHRMVYAAQFDPNGHGGVFRSGDGGRTWVDLTGGMTTTWIESLALAPAGDVLYAGTTAYGLESGGGVFAARVR
jgi:photosystem II stability/assembly factor-like uncharacterized protein